VNASKTAKARTLPVRTIIGKPKLTPVVTGWETTPITLGFGQTRSADARVNIADGDELVMVTEARASLAPGAWGPWVITDERGVAYWDNGTKIAVPGPGTWQVRIRTQSSATYNPVVSSARTVTMAPPACSVLRSAAWNGLTYHECEVVVRPSASIDQNVYVLHYTGPADLAALSAPAIVSYFHGDGGDPRWPRDGTGIHPELMSETEAWALGRGYLWVGAISPLTYQGAPWWGATQGLFHWTVALNVGRDVAALGRFVGAAHYAYYGHSGGSWFLGEAFLPAGIQEAPGPVAMNCGSSSPWPPEARTARPYGIWWWLPSRDASIRTRVPLQFNVGDQDFLFDTVTGAHSNYKRMGFTTERNVYPGVPHCGISFDDDNIRWFSQHMPTP
jgi:hypothetical protein